MKGIVFYCALVITLGVSQSYGKIYRNSPFDNLIRIVQEEFNNLSTATGDIVPFTAQPQTDQKRPYTLTWKGECCTTEDQAKVVLSLDVSNTDPSQIKISLVRDTLSVNIPLSHGQKQITIHDNRIEFSSIERLETSHKQDQSQTSRYNESHTTWVESLPASIDISKVKASLQGSSLNLTLPINPINQERIIEIAIE
jgi:HSP20 family molecular chaperone IbpA